MKLVKLSTWSLNNEDMFAVSTSSLEICKPILETSSPVIKTAYTQLNDVTKELGVQLNRNRASSLTKIINTENKNSDKVWRQIKRQLNLMAENMGNAEKAVAAAELIELFKPYWYAEDLAQNTQAKAFKEMFSKYTEAEKAKGVLVGIDELMEVLLESNTLMDDAWTKRNDLQGNMDSTTPATTLSRKVVKSYNALMTLLMHESEFMKNEKLDAVMADLNALRSKYATLLTIRKIALEKKKEEKKKKEEEKKRAE